MKFVVLYFIVLRFVDLYFQLLEQMAFSAIRSMFVF